MAGDDGRCGVAVAVVLRAGRQNNQDFSAKITKMCAKITKNMNGVILVFCSVYRPASISQAGKSTFRIAAWVMGSPLSAVSGTETRSLLPKSER